MYSFYISKSGRKEDMQTYTFRGELHNANGGLKVNSFKRHSPLTFKKEILTSPEVQRCLQLSRLFAGLLSFCAAILDLRAGCEFLITHGWAQHVDYRETHPVIS